jgi:hypothetical protein
MVPALPLEMTAVIAQVPFAVAQLHRLAGNNSRRTC